MERTVVLYPFSAMAATGIAQQFIVESGEKARVLRWRYRRQKLAFQPFAVLVGENSGPQRKLEGRGLEQRLYPPHLVASAPLRPLTLIFLAGRKTGPVWLRFVPAYPLIFDLFTVNFVTTHNNSLP